MVEQELMQVLNKIDESSPEWITLAHNESQRHERQRVEDSRNRFFNS